VVNVSSPSRFELSWRLPQDNGEPIDYFEITAFPVRPVGGEELGVPGEAGWERVGNVFR